MSVVVAPRAMCAAVDIEQGQMTTASGPLLPLAGSAPRSSGANTCAVAPARSRNSAVTAARVPEGSLSSCLSTRMPLSEMLNCSRQPAAASARTTRAAYGAPLAPLTPRNTVCGGVAMVTSP